MHGIIFFAMRRYVERNLGGQAWDTLLAESGLSGKSYLPTETYPDEEVVALVKTAAVVTQSSPIAVLESFGEYLGPELLMLNSSLVDPEWKTLDVIANTEETIHTVIRMKNPGATPPVLRVQRLSDTQVQLVYSSKRQLCAVAKGMARGLARHFGETVEIHEESCMMKGDPFCSIVFERVAVEDQPDGRLTDSKQQLLSDSAQVRNVWDTPGATVSSMAAAPNAPAVKPVAPVAPAAVAPTVDPRFSFLAPPQAEDELGRLGDYRVQRLLGQGAMGLVFLAEDPSLQRQVAIKVMSPNTASFDKARDRFLREARSMAALDHQLIVPIYHVGEATGCRSW